MTARNLARFCCFLFCIGCSDDNINSGNDSDTSEGIETDTASDIATDEKFDGDTETFLGSDTNHNADTGVDTASDDCLAHGDHRSALVFVNQCDDPLTFQGSDIQSAKLQPGQSACRDLGSDVDAISSIRFWGYIGPDPGGEHHTLAEMTLNTDFYDFDWYNISHVDAFNLPMAIIPLEKADCPTKSCPDDLLTNCPEEGRYVIAGELVSCVSPDRNNPDSVVARYFDEGCTDAYAWSGDDADSMAACAGEDYAIVFCP